MKKEERVKNNFFKRKETRLLAPYFVFALFIFSLFFVFIFYNYREQISFIKQSQEELGLRVSGEIDSFIIRVSNDLKILSKSLECLSCEDQNKKMIESLFDVNPYVYSACIFSEDSGQRILSLGRYSSESFGFFEQSSNDFLKVQKDFYLSPVNISDFGLPFVLMSVPIFDDNEKKIGILVSQIDLSALWSIVSKSSFRESGYVYLLDNSARLISYRDILAVMAEKNLRSISIIDDFLNHKHSFAVYSSYFSNKVFGSWSYVKSTGWGLFVELPVKEFVIDFLPFIVFSILVFILFLIFIFKILSLMYKLEKANIKIGESEKKFRSYIDEAPDGIMVVDYSGRIIEFNNSLMKMTSNSFKKMEKMKVYDLICDKDLDLVKNHFKKVIKTGGDEIDVLYKKNSDKNNCVYYFNLSSVKLSDKFILVFIKDVTIEKEVDRAKTEFVSLASHQLRTPLAAINWYSEMLLAGDGGKLSENQKKFAQEIFDSNKRMVELVNSLLNVSRLEMGTFIISPEPTNFVEVMDDVLKEQKVAIVDKNINIKKEYDNNLSKLKYDPKLLRIIFQNLTSNAIKYSPSNSTVSISIKINQRKKMIEIEVKDEGYGIQNNQQNQIFQKLFRADNIKKRNTEGTGLGLYIVKSIVDNFKGSISFRSKENKGTAFKVLLPLDGVSKKEGNKSLS